MLNLDGSRAAARTRRALGSHRSSSPRLRGGVAVAVGVACALTWAGPGFSQTGGAPTTQTPTDTTLHPRVPGTTNAKSPFKADRASSEPLGLAPNQASDPFTYPAEPIVLHWSPVPGAVTYKVEISSAPGFTSILWSRDTDQIMVAPELLVPDGQYWWRVTATDAAGTKGVVSQVAKFAKNWPSTISGGILSASPMGEAVSVVRITPHMRWNHLPGGAYYETQIAAADQFAQPIFRSENFPVGTMNTGVFVMPDDGYSWRVRALDANKNPGQWTTMGSFTKAWTGVNVIGPADAAETSDFNLSWEPLSGAERYQVQITRTRHTWQGDALVFNTVTGNTAVAPDIGETQAKGMSPGAYYWRVRPMVKDVVGTWSAPRQVVWAEPTVTATVPTLLATPDSTNALSPTMSWTPVAGAHIYRVDVSTDAQFNNIVEQVHTRTTSWTPRSPLLDNQVRDGYFWRVLWGSGYAPAAPAWMEDEGRVPVGHYSKQTQVTLGDAASGVVTEPPMFTWSDVPGAARYEVQLSRDAEFASDRTETDTVWGLGSAWLKDKGKRLASGSWFWRVRAVDAAGNGQTWSPHKSFTLNPPRATLTGPNDGATVVGSPLMTWNPQPAACAYQVQSADNPGFQGAEATTAPTLQTGGGFTPGGTTNAPVAAAADGAITTPQSALVMNGLTINHPGTWYWRVRTQFCGEEDFSAWSPSQKFISVRPPQFNLNTVPNKVTYGRRVTVGGQLKSNGAAVKRPTLLVERRLWPATGYTVYGTVKGDANGKFAFSLPIRRTASWRVRWAQTATNPEGVAPFVIRATPRVSFSLARKRVVRTSPIKVKGSVFPRRDVRIQVRDGQGWTTVRTLKKVLRFNVAVRPKVGTGPQRLRLFVPRDTARRLEATPSTARNLFVYDKFVVRKGR